MTPAVAQPPHKRPAPVADAENVEDDEFRTSVDAVAAPFDADQFTGVGDEELTPPERRPVATTRLGLAMGLAILSLMGGVVGWLGYEAYQSHRHSERDQLFLAAGRQTALNLTTIDYTHAEADVQRILDSGTGQFYDDFHSRSTDFIDLVKQAQSKSTGTIADAGLESVNGDDAQVLVAATVTTSTAGTDDQRPRGWRMRITVQMTGDGARASKVEFVP